MTRSGAGRADGVAQLIERPHLSGRGRGAARPARTSAQTSAEASARRRPPQNRSATIAASTRTRRAAVAADSSPRPRRRRFAGGEHQLAGLVVGQRAGLARRRRGLPGVLAGDAACRRRAASSSGRPGRWRGRRRRSPRQRSGPWPASTARPARRGRRRPPPAGRRGPRSARPAHQRSNRRHGAA